MYCLRTVHGTHNTIHTFKNYFTILFSIFSKISCIQTDSICVKIFQETYKEFLV